MIYLSSFMVSDHRMRNPNVYPYHVFRNKEIYPMVFAPITIIYGNNGSGKSTLLNIIAQKIGARGCETYAYGQDYINKFVRECKFDTGEDDFGRKLRIPKNSLYIKSEDILFEIKKIQQEEALERGYVFEVMKQKGVSREAVESDFHGYGGMAWTRKEILQFETNCRVDKKF